MFFWGGQFGPAAGGQDHPAEGGQLSPARGDFLCQLFHKQVMSEFKNRHSGMKMTREPPPYFDTS